MAQGALGAVFGIALPNPTGSGEAARECMINNYCIKLYCINKQIRSQADKHGLECAPPRPYLLHTGAVVFRAQRFPYVLPRMGNGFPHLTLIQAFVRQVSIESHHGSKPACGRNFGPAAWNPFFHRRCRAPREQDRHGNAVLQARILTWLRALFFCSLFGRVCGSAYNHPLSRQPGKLLLRRHPPLHSPIFLHVVQESSYLSPRSFLESDA